MARELYPGVLVQRPDGTPAPFTAFTLWTNYAAGSDITTSVKAPDGTSAYTPVTDSAGLLTPFTGPDGHRDPIFVDTGVGQRFMLLSSTVLDDFDELDPPAGWTARTRGWLAENYPLILGDNQTALPTAGRLEVVRLTLPVAASITNVLVYAQAGGTSLTSGQNFAVLYSSAGARIGVTADQTTAWGSSGLKTMALAGGPFAGAAADYYVAFWFNGTTGPAFVRKSVSSGANQLNAGFSAPNLLWASADTGLTTTSPATMGTQTAQALAWWVGLS